MSDSFDTERWVIDPVTHCWNWTGGLLRGYPYGRAHRKAYEQAKGPIPTDHHVHHLCANKACVNPDHLEAIKPDEHFLHHYLTERGLTLDDVREIRELGRRRGGPSAIAIGKRYGLWEKSIYRYWNAEVWQEILEDGPVELEDGICALDGCDGVVTGSRHQIYCTPRCTQRAYLVRSSRKQES